MKDIGENPDLDRWSDGYHSAAAALRPVFYNELRRLREITRQAKSISIETNV